MKAEAPAQLCLHGGGQVPEGEVGEGRSVVRHRTRQRVAHFAKGFVAGQIPALQVASGNVDAKGRVAEFAADRRMHGGWQGFGRGAQGVKAESRVLKDEGRVEASAVADIGRAEVRGECLSHKVRGSLKGPARRGSDEDLAVALEFERPCDGCARPRFLKPKFAHDSAEFVGLGHAA